MSTTYDRGTLIEAATHLRDLMAGVRAGAESPEKLWYMLTLLSLRLPPGKLLQLSGWLLQEYEALVGPLPKLVPRPLSAPPPRPKANPKPAAPKARDLFGEF
jgi:hypothetical protein